MLYDTRLHSFGSDAPRDPEIERFIESVHRIFRATFASVLPRFLRTTLFRKYQRLNDDGWDSVFSTGQCTCTLLVTASLVQVSARVLCWVTFRPLFNQPTFYCNTSSFFSRKGCKL